MATISGSLSPSIGFSYTPATGAFAGQVLQVKPPTTPTFSLSPGTAAGQGDTIYQATLSLAASTPLTIDLTNLLDPLGTAISFARVRYFYCRNAATTDGFLLTLGGASSNPWTAIWSGNLAVGPSITGTGGVANSLGKFEMWAPQTTGYAVTGTSKILQFSSGSNAFNVELLIVGASV